MSMQTSSYDGDLNQIIACADDIRSLVTVSIIVQHCTNTQSPLLIGPDSILQKLRYGQRNAWSMLE